MPSFGADTILGEIGIKLAEQLLRSNEVTRKLQLVLMVSK